jgi:hypothetical protein
MQIPPRDGGVACVSELSLMGPAWRRHGIVALESGILEDDDRRRRARSLIGCMQERLVGATGFELGTPCTPY